MAYLPLLLAVLAGIVILKWMTGASRRRQRRLTEPFPDSWRKILKKNVPITSNLPAELWGRFEKLVQRFIIDVPFEGAGGLEISQEIRVTIAGQACLLVLGNDRNFSKLRSIVVYPSTYTPVIRDAGGDLVAAGHDNLGESWGDGYVVLAWDAVLHGAVDFQDGQNVVIHEFAHQIDQEDDLDGHADGIPVPAGGSNHQIWAEVIDKNLEALRRRVQRHAKTVLDPYGATDEAELFAVATETYFEKPRDLLHSHPELYRLLDELYGLDPISWHRAR